MTVRSRDNGRWADYPRTCTGCGSKLTLKDVLWLEAVVDKAGAQVKRAFHHKCRSGA